jgi:hypothetical protein
MATLVYNEILSRTRVRGIQPNERFAVPGFSIRGTGTVSATTKHIFGPYRLVRVLWKTETESLLEARDELLDRNVWIHEHTINVSEPASESRTSRSGRLRWLHGSRDEAARWDAYEAPRGIPFCRWVHQRGGLSWLEMRAILQGLAEAVRVDSDGLSSIPDLCLSNIWIDPTGQPKITEFPIELDDEQLHFQRYKSTDWLQFLRDVATFGLTNESSPPRNGQVDRPAVPLPSYAQNLLDHMWRGDVSNALQLVRDFQIVSSRPASVSAIRRLGPVLLTALWLFGNLPNTLRMSTMVFRGHTLWLDEMENIPQYSARLHELEQSTGPDVERQRESVRKVLAFIYSEAHSSENGRNILSSFPPEWVTDLEAAWTRYPRLTNRELLEARMSLSTSGAQALPANLSPEIAAITQAPWLLISYDALMNGIPVAKFAIPVAFILGTSPLLWIFGIGLQTKRGKKAGRLRCGLRASAAWLPFLMWSAFLGSDYRTIFTKGVLNWELALIVGSVLFLGIAFSLARPGRSIPDVLAGTYLVPR